MMDMMMDTMDMMCDGAYGCDEEIQPWGTGAYNELDGLAGLYEQCGYDPSDPESPTPAEVEAELAQRQWDELERDRLAEEAAEEEEFVQAVWRTFHCQAG